MSLDLFGFPERGDPHGAKAPELAGQGRVLLSQSLMPEYLRWSRVDALTCAAGANTYLAFDLPALPVGSVIRAVCGVTAAGANDGTAVGISRDWMLATPSIDTILALLTNAAFGPAHHTIFVTGRNGAEGYSLNSGGNSQLATTPDWSKANRLAVYGVESTALVVQGAFVEVFIPRVLRV